MEMEDRKAAVFTVHYWFYDNWFYDPEHYRESYRYGKHRFRTLVEAKEYADGEIAKASCFVEVEDTRTGVASLSHFSQAAAILTQEKQLSKLNNPERKKIGTNGLSTEWRE
jgi:hypothetical protein